MSALVLVGQLFVKSVYYVSSDNGMSSYMPWNFWLVLETA